MIPKIWNEYFCVRQAYCFGIYLHVVSYSCNFKLMGSRLIILINFYIKFWKPNYSSLFYLFYWVILQALPQTCGIIWHHRKIHPWVWSSLGHVLGTPSSPIEKIKKILDNCLRHLHASFEANRSSTFTLNNGLRHRDRRTDVTSWHPDRHHVIAYRICSLSSTKWAKN